MRKVPISEARRKLGELVNAAHYLGQPTQITRNGRPVAAIVPPADASFHELVQKTVADSRPILAALE